MAKAKKKGMYILGVLIIIAATVLVCYFIFHKKPDKGLKFDDNATTGILPGIDIDQRRKELQKEVDRGMIAFTINTSPVFLNGSSQGNLFSAFYHFLISLFITKHFILERFAIYPFVVSLAAIADITSCYQKNAGSDSRQARAFHFVRLQFLVFGAAYFLFAAARGFHNVYPYISLLSKSSAVPIP